MTGDEGENIFDVGGSNPQPPRNKKIRIYRTFCRRMARPEGLSAYGRSARLRRLSNSFDVEGSNPQNSLAIKKVRIHRTFCCRMARPEGLSAYGRSARLRRLSNSFDVEGSNPQNSLAIKKVRIHRTFCCRMARPEGFEPPTTWFVARYSIQLSYGRKIEVRILVFFDDTVNVKPIIRDESWRRERDSNPRWSY